VNTAESKNIKEAMVDSTWIEAMQEELHQFDRLQVWELVDKPFGKMVIKLKWLWKNKMDEDQTVIHNKVRLVAKGYAQEEFAPILGYGDLVQGNVMINMVYYVEGHNHNLFSVGSNPQDEQPSTNIPSTSTPSTHTFFHVEENNNDQAEEGEHVQDDEFTNPLCTPAQDVTESSSHNIGNSNVPTFNQP
nr:Gag-Pol polyprotein [Tanacetum cinerariifolium]